MVDETLFSDRILSLQQIMEANKGDEHKNARALMDMARRLSGAEQILIKRRGEGSPITLARYCLHCDETEEVNDRDIYPLFNGPGHRIHGGDECFWGVLTEPIPLKDPRFFLRNFMVVISGRFGREDLEITLVNLEPGRNSDSLISELKALLNLLGRESYISILKARIGEKESEISRVIESKTQFLGSLSHEVRSPLNGIICMGSLLRETELDEEQRDLLNIIQFSADNITRIIQDLVDITMLSSGKVILKNESFSLKTFSSNLLKNIREEASQKGLTLNMSMDENLDTFHGDQVRLSQVITNLLQNAVKYTREGEIFLEIRADRKTVDFIISDTGQGIAPDKQDVIFEEFVQLDRSAVRKGEYKGVGLGLAIVKDLVTMMGGSVTVRSREGKGSSFTVSLPRTSPEKARCGILRAGENTPLGARILVVDDDEINRLFLRTILEKGGAVVEEADNGLTAVEMAGGESYHMILMDISMPVMNGLDATGEIRKTNPDIPVLAVTANAFQDDLKRILEAGLDDVVLKPVNEDQLMEKIATWLVRREGIGYGE